MSAAPTVASTTPQPPVEAKGPAEKEDEEAPGSSTTLEKKDRKKLKKLRKRALQPQTEAERSGLLTRLEWLEFQKLLIESSVSSSSPTNTVGTSLSRRKGKEGNKVEGSHHRDLLAWLLQQVLHPSSTSSKLQSSKKRSRSPSNSSETEVDPLKHPKLPSWASLHNPGAVECIVVLEVQLGAGQLDRYQTMLESVLKDCQDQSYLALPTKWFQGYAPKSMSEGLLYYVSQQSNQHKRPKVSEVQTEPALPSKEDIAKELGKLLFPLDEWPSEGYPQVKKAFNHKSAYAGMPTFSGLQDPSLIPFEQAQEWVQKYGVQVERQDEADLKSYVCTGGIDLDDGDAEQTTPRIFGMDCEMVLTSAGSELARITLIQFEGLLPDEKMKTTTVVDTLVKPANPVKDYLTRHSGITPELLMPVTTRLEQVQFALAQFLRPTDILVGHSLENDLIATHYIHPRVVDTALVFRHKNKRTKFSLRHLAATLLKQTIQRGSHCSEEDARTTLELAIRRAWIGEDFGLPGNDERRSLLEILNTKAEVKAVGIGPPAWLQCHITNHSNGIHALSYESIPQCRKAVLAWMKGLRKAQLSWCLMKMEEGESRNEFEALHQMLADMFAQSSPTTMVLIAFQEGLDRARAELKKKRACQDPRSTFGWTVEQESAWKPILDCSRSGIANWIGSSNTIRREK